MTSVRREVEEGIGPRMCRKADPLAGPHQAVGDAIRLGIEIPDDHGAIQRDSQFQPGEQCDAIELFAREGAAKPARLQHLVEPADEVIDRVDISGVLANLIVREVRVSPPDLRQQSFEDHRKFAIGRSRLRVGVRSAVVGSVNAVHSQEPEVAIPANRARIRSYVARLTDLTE